MFSYSLFPRCVKRCHCIGMGYLSVYTLCRCNRQTLLDRFFLLVDLCLIIDTPQMHTHTRNALIFACRPQQWIYFGESISRSACMIVLEAWSCFELSALFKKFYRDFLTKKKKTHCVKINEICMYLHDRQQFKLNMIIVNTSNSPFLRRHKRPF